MSVSQCTTVSLGAWKQAVQYMLSPEAIVKGKEVPERSSENMEPGSCVQLMLSTVSRSLPPLIRTSGQIAPLLKQVSPPSGTFPGKYGPTALRALSGGVVSTALPVTNRQMERVELYASRYFTVKVSVYWFVFCGA